MLPLFLDLTRLRLVLAGNGDAAVRRLALLDEAGARQIEIYAADPVPALILAAGPRLIRRWPGSSEIARAQLVFIADPPRAQRIAMASAARAARVIVHVEDEPALGDAQAPAVLRRGALTLAVSTGGASPALAAQVRDFLGRLFGPEWGERLEAVSRQRLLWREAGLNPAAISRRTGEWVKRRGWLPARPRTVPPPEA
jgi:precorrin-2 dehydrogenase/sirohydrochlorin ferrochelatase